MLSLASHRSVLQTPKFLEIVTKVHEALWHNTAPRVAVKLGHAQCDSFVLLVTGMFDLLESMSLVVTPPGHLST